MKITILSIFTFFSLNTFGAGDCAECIGPDKGVNSYQNISLNVSLKILCDSEYKKEDWDNLTKNIDYNNLTNEDVLILMSKYAKPGSVKTKEDIDIVLKLYSHYYSTYPRRDLYKFKYLDIYDPSLPQIDRGIKNLKLNPSVKNYDRERDENYQKDLCLSAKERKEKKFTLLVHHISQYGINEPLRDVPDLILDNLDFIKSLPKEKQDEIFYPLYRGLGSYLSDIHDVTLSKALIFSKNYVNDLLGREKLKKIVDVTPSADGKDLLILSTSPILDDSTDGSIITTPILNISKSTFSENKILTFVTDKKKYKIDLKVSQIRINDYIDDSPSPDYKKMLADKKLTGMTLISPNLGSWKDKTSQNYLSYYLDKGFKFGEPTELNDSSAWIKEKIGSGEIDYILKEAHTGGNNYDLIGLSLKHKIMIGKKQRSDGSEEVIYLLFPQEDVESMRISFSDMNELMEKREKNGNGQLLYLNSSCWSMDDAPETVGRIKNKGFINIASPSKTTTFFNGENSTKYRIIEGIRNQKNYAEIHAQMAETSRHKHGYNDFIFPGEKRYSENISDGSDYIEDYDIKLFDENGKQLFLHDN